MRWMIGSVFWLATLLPLAADVTPPTPAKPAAPAAAAMPTRIPTAPVPAWVDEMPAPPESPELRAEAQGGVLYLLSDYQLRWRDNAKETYARTTLLVTDRSGLDTAASFSLDYDPLLESMTLLDLRITRDGKETVLTDTVTPEVMRRETMLEQGILDGTVTAWYQIPDLRVGDVVDYASLRVSRPVLPGGDRSVEALLEWSVPVVLTRTVVHWPEGWAINQAPLPARVVMAEGPGPDGSTRLEFQRVNHIPDRPEDHVPASVMPLALLQLSADSDWGRINSELSPHYMADYPLTPEWEEKLAAIEAADPSPEGRAIAAMRLVQDEIRYISLSFGAGGVLARPPTEVITSGFGDCKDKALLLSVLLRRMGMEAHVALVNMDRGKALGQHLPMLGAFDHAIVRLRLAEDDTYWMDATRTHQGGDLWSMAGLDYGFALPLAGGGQRMVEAIFTAPDLVWTSSVREGFRFSAMGLFLDVEARYSGGAADSMRQRWASQPRSAISADYHDFYLDRLPGLRLLNDIVMTDDRDSNVLTMRESYYLSPMDLRAGDLDLDFPFAAEDFAADMPEDLPLPRRNPMRSGTPGVYNHQIEVTGAAIDFTPPDPIWLQNRAFSYALDGMPDDPGGMILSWTYTATGADVPAREVAEVLEQRRRVYDTTWYGWNLRP